VSDTTTDLIVVALDGSALADTAAPVASRLADTAGGRLVLLSVGSDARGEELRRHLTDVAAGIRGVPVDTVIVPGWDAAKEIVAYASAHSATVCMTSHGRGALRWAVLGSVAEWVVEECPRPVVLVGPRCPTDWAPGTGPVLLCHDGSDMPDAVVDAACSAARRFDTSILVATVIHPLDVAGAELPEQLFDEIEGRIRDRGFAVEHSVEQRHFPAGVLADLATDRQAPVVVMAAHSRHGVARFVVGSTTMTVLHLAPCPVIAVNSRE
jgi:nucleotide-binding universal stress UspA family protein